MKISDDVTPRQLQSGNNPMPAVGIAMNKIDKDKARRLPILSPTGPKIADPMGRTNNPTDTLKKLKMEQKFLSPYERNFCDKIGRNGMSSAKLYQVSTFPMAP
jgi:hypothetical protein